MKADFKAQPLLNKSEARLFKAMDKMVIELAPPGWQVMAQVSLGEILRCEDKAAYACINSKRVDLLIVDADCRPIHAIEYQGGAHFKGAHATAARDAVKKEALRRAGIGYVEVVAGDTPAELRRVVERLVQSSLVHLVNCHRNPTAIQAHARVSRVPTCAISPRRSAPTSTKLLCIRSSM